MQTMKKCEKKKLPEKKPSSIKPIDPKMWERIQGLRLMDDDFMTIVFSGDNKLTEFLLRILLDRKDLTVKQSLTQKERHNIFGRSVRLDILAVDTEGKQYNIEIQRADKGASEKRARYNLSMIDSHSLKKNDNFEVLPETYIIFITENDIYGEKEPIYDVKQSITTKKGKVLPFDNGVHTIYVNGAYNGEDAIGWLMHDFRESNADKMHYAEIAERVRFHKQEDGEVSTVCRAFEEYGKEKAAEARKETQQKERKSMAIELLKQNKLSIAEIVAVSHLSLEQVQKLAEQVKSQTV
jgi:hypothetical protein